MIDMHLFEDNSGRNTTPESQRYGTGLQHTWSATPMPNTTPMLGGMPHDPVPNMLYNQQFRTQGKSSYLTMLHALNHSVK